MSARAVSRRKAAISAANALATAAAYLGDPDSAVTVTTSDSPAALIETVRWSSSAVAPRNRFATRTATVSSEASARFVAAARSGSSPVSVVPPAMIASAFVARPNSRSALASYLSGCASDSSAANTNAASTIVAMSRQRARMSAMNRGRSMPT
jgi:hypothetical protein